MPFEIKPASRAQVKALIGLYGKSGGGKTLSALLFMRGLVGPKGRIVGVDSENRRMSIFADQVPGGFSVIDLDPPFNPERYAEAIQAAQAQADGIVVDSFSHEWAGEDGVLDQHEQELDRMVPDPNDWKKREQCTMTAWIRPKMAHKRLVEKLLRLPLPLIVCMRGEEKTRMLKENNKTVVHTDQFSSPIGDPRFIFEMLIHAEAFARPNAQGHLVGGYLRITKTPAEAIPLLPKAEEQASTRHGEALARWCAGGSGAAAAYATQIPPAGAKASGPPANLKKLKSALWKMTAPIHQDSPRNLEQWLIDEAIISDTEKLETLALSRYPAIIEAVTAKLARPKP